MKIKSLFRKIWEITPLAILLFALWVVFTSKTNWHHLLLGAIMAFLFSWLSYYLLRGRLDPNLNVSVAVRFPIYAAILFWEIIKANWDVMKRVLAPSFPISPRIVEFDSYLESDIAKTALANAITLTPGTVTVEIEKSRFFIHCISEDQVEDPGSGKLQRMTAWLFGEGPEDMRRLT